MSKFTLKKGKECLFYKHGFSHKERLYEIWKNMKRRCNDNTLSCYKNYGGRGIGICNEWESDYINFRNWAMSAGYNDTLTIDRINVNGNYEPSNCRWSTYREQNNNRSNNRIMTINGYTSSLADICRKYNVKYKMVWKRLKLGWSLEDAIIKERGC